MAKTVRTKIREAIIYNLNEIKKSNDYENNVGDVFSEARPLDDMRNFPAIMVNFGPHKCLNAEDGTTTQGFILDYECTVTLTIFIKNAQNTEEHRESIVGDIQKLFMNSVANRSIPDKDGNATAREMMFIDDESFGFEGTKGVVQGHKLNFWVRYAQVLGDPTTLA